jgi:hypothetical protein
MVISFGYVTAGTIGTASRYFSKDYRQSSLDNQFSTTTTALTTDSLLSVQDF